jgi:hypothetical protein
MSVTTTLILPALGIPRARFAIAMNARTGLLARRQQKQYPRVISTAPVAPTSATIRAICQARIWSFWVHVFTTMSMSG